MSKDGGAQCAVSIAALAKDKRFAPRATELEALSRDLANPEDDTWAGVDLFAAFPPESSIEVRHRNIFERVLGVFAAVSVFLPVGWTWTGFHRASAAYEQMIMARGEPEGKTFLGLWASGFNGRLDPGDRLAPMASFSIVLIGFAITCLVLHRVVADINVRHEERKFALARTELTKQLTAASLVLNERRADHPQRIEGVIKSSLDKLRKTQDAARKAVVELSTTAENVSTGLNELVSSVLDARTQTETLLAQAKDTHRALEEATARTGESVSKSISSLDAVVRTGVDVSQAAVTRSVGAVETSLRQSIQASQDSVRTSALELTRQLTDAVAVLEQSFGRHLSSLTDEAIGAIGQSGGALLGVVDRIGGSAEATAAAASSFAEQVGVLRDDNVVAREDMVNALGDVRSTLQEIESVLDRHETTLQGQASELTSTRDAAERMLRQLVGSAATSNGHGAHAAGAGH